MTGTCRTCRWWNKEPIHNFGGCDCRKLRYAVTTGIHDIPESEVWYADQNGHVPNVIFGPDFGCIHWEAKDDNS